jgi:CheY-like chemotaxis protein
MSANFEEISQRDEVLTQPRVLLVEDTETTRRRMSEVLHTNGYEVVEATDGEEALQKLGEAPFDAVLLDLLLPKIDGWQFRAAQLRHPGLAAIPTVVVSVKALREVDRYVLRVRNSVLKPFEEVHLLDAVRRACVESPRRAARLQARPSKAFADLRWSRLGEVACIHHAPPVDSERWRIERWTAIPEGAGNHRIFYQCQHCPGREGPIRRRRSISDGDDSLSGT